MVSMSLFWNDEQVPAMVVVLSLIRMLPMRTVVPAEQLTPVPLWVDTLRSMSRIAPLVTAE
jgi:hypothetical protein